MISVLLQTYWFMATKSGYNTVRPMIRDISEGIF